MTPRRARRPVYRFLARLGATAPAFGAVLAANNTPAMNSNSDIKAIATLVFILGVTAMVAPVKTIDFFHTLIAKLTPRSHVVP